MDMMQIIIDNQVAGYVPDLKGFRIDPSHPVMKLNADQNVVPQVEGRYDSYHATNRLTSQSVSLDSAISPEQLKYNTGKSIQWQSQPRKQLVIDEERMQRMQKIRGADLEYFQWAGSMIDRVEPIFGTLTLDKQAEYQRDFTQKQHAYLREVNPDAFRACLCQEEIIDEIKSGYSPTLGNFTMDDWFGFMGEHWEQWISDIRWEIGGDTDNSHERYVYEQAELRGLL